MSKIEWTDYTFNPWWGCTRVSPGCEHCYAQTFSHRLGMDLWGPTAGRRFFDDHHWGQPLAWARRRAKGDRRHRVFCASMADVFEDDRRLDGQRARLWTLIEETPGLTWQLLTKRPQNAQRLTPSTWRDRWPANTWALTTAEDQERADERIPQLLQIPAGVHGVSYEPALGPVDFSDGPLDPGSTMGPWSMLDQIDWLIVGGESGPGARPFDVAWARSVIRQCREAGVPCFTKQLGAQPFDGELRVRLQSAKGGDPSEWPQDLRVREFPSSGARRSGANDRQSRVVGP